MINCTFSFNSSTSSFLNKGCISKNVFGVPSVETSNASAILEIFEKLPRNNVNNSVFVELIEYTIG